MLPVNYWIRVWGVGFSSLSLSSLFKPFLYSIDCGVWCTRRIMERICHSNTAFPNISKHVFVQGEPSLSWGLSRSTQELQQEPPGLSNVRELSLWRNHSWLTTASAIKILPCHKLSVYAYVYISWQLCTVLCEHLLQGLYLQLHMLWLIRSWSAVTFIFIITDHTVIRELFKCAGFQWDLKLAGLHYFSASFCLFFQCKMSRF